jgi:hypothetical protein
MIKRFDDREIGTSAARNHCLASHVFVILLEEYLQSCDELSIFKSCETNFLSNRQAFCGLALLSFQNSLSFELLLRDGKICI